MAQMSAPATAAGWKPRAHLLLTGLLLAGVLVVAGMAAAGRVHFGKPGPIPSPGPGAEPARWAEGNPKTGRYQIEKVDDMRQVLEGAGKLRFFGEHLLEAWVFKYRGGYLQCHLETEINGRPAIGEPLPNNWTSLLTQDDGVREGRASAFDKHGYIVMAAVPATITLADAEEKYRPHLLGLLAGAPYGPLHALAPLHFDVAHVRPYRLFVSAGPAPTELGAGFNVWCENGLLVREAIVGRGLAEEEVHVGGGVDLTPGKDILLLDRKRGYSRVRLKARFLGDGEVREMAAKK
jgi:hypothetical protein